MFHTRLHADLRTIYENASALETLLIQKTIYLPASLRLSTKTSKGRQTESECGTLYAVNGGLFPSLLTLTICRWDSRFLNTLTVVSTSMN